MIKKIKKNKKGFTLIELIVVVAIIAILAAVAVPSYLSAQTKAKESVARGNAAVICQAINATNALASTDAEDIDALPAYAALSSMLVPVDMLEADYTAATAYITFTAETGTGEIGGATAKVSS